MVEKSRDLMAKFVIGDEPEIERPEGVAEGVSPERSWELYWQRSRSVPDTFLRSEKALEHPGRIFIADKCAEIGGSVLECGSATAVDYPLYLERGLNYHAIDITPKFVAKAKEIYPELDIREASVLNLPFEDGEFDTVYIRAVFEHMHPDEWPHGLVEMWRVANKRVIVGLYLRPNMKQYDGPLLPSPPTRTKGTYTKRVNKDHLEKLLDMLKMTYFMHETSKISEKKGKHRVNWIWVADKRSGTQIPLEEI